VYNTTPFNYFIGKKLIKVEHLAIVNILSGKTIVKEFIQKDFNENNLHFEGMKILTHEKYRNQLIENFKNLKNILTKSQPTVNAADIVCSYLK
jgi:lipid-A-disaccharide synthase